MAAHRKPLVGKAGVLVLLLVTGPALAVPPISLTFFGTYGSPVAPAGFVSFTQHGFGFNGLIDYNPMNMVSVGLGFEKITFDGATSSSDTANLELKLFPFENGKKYFSPYITGGAGINLSSTGGVAPFQLKAGLGTRVSVISALYLDMGFESHWFVDPGASQYVGARAGLSYSFDFQQGKQDATAPQEDRKSAPKATPKEDPKAKTNVSSVDSESEVDIAPASSRSKASEKPEAREAPADLRLENVPMRGAKPTPTPEEEEEVAEEEEAASEDTEMMKLYRSGTRAYLKSDYKTALQDLRKCVAIEDDSVKPLYYAEANALLGVVYHVKKDDATAVKFYRKALGYNPKNFAALKYLRKLGEKINVKQEAPEETADEAADEAGSGEEVSDEEETAGEEEEAKD